MENNKEKSKGTDTVHTVPTPIAVREKEVNVLDSITGKYTVKPILKSYLAENNPNHDGAVLYSRAFVLFSPGKMTKDITNTGLNSEQERAFEKELFKAPGALSKYSDFWASYTIKIKREGTKLDCDNSVHDKLAYLILKAESNTSMGKVVMSEAERLLSGFAEFLVQSDEIEAKAKTKDLTFKKKAFAYFSTMSSEDQKDFLNVWKEGKYKINDSTKLSLIEAKVGEVVDEFPEQFLELVQSSNYKDMIFLGKCYTNRLVNKVGPKYVTLDGELLGSSYLDTLANLQLPEYNAIKVSLVTKLQALEK